MQKPGVDQLSLSAACALCVAEAWAATVLLEPGELSGGYLTGPLLSMNDWGSVLFLLALVCAFFYPRIAAAIAATSSLLCLPLYVFFIAPVPFANAFAPDHEFKGRWVPGIHWDTSSIGAILTLAFTLYICYRVAFAFRVKRIA